MVRSARTDDAAAIAALTARAWEGRPFFAGAPTTSEVARLLQSTDPDLYLVAEAGAPLVGLASAVVRARCVEIDDVQVDPRWQRRGLATHLVTVLLARISQQTHLPIRLHTEGHDPSGARSLYERLGFRVIDTHHRLRKTL